MGKTVTALDESNTAKLIQLLKNSESLISKLVLGQSLNNYTKDYLYILCKNLTLAIHELENKDA